MQQRAQKSKFRRPPSTAQPSRPGEVACTVGNLRTLDYVDSDETEKGLEYIYSSNDGEEELNPLGATAEMPLDSITASDSGYGSEPTVGANLWDHMKGVNPAIVEKRSSRIYTRPEQMAV